MLTVAFVGLGTIGEEVVKHLEAYRPSVRVLGALVTSPAKRRNATCPIFSSLEDLLASGPDLVVECSRQHALRELGAKILLAGKDLLAASAGALADSTTCDALRRAAVTGGAQLFIPAGALAGIDALAAARQVGIATVRYTRRAPPATWAKLGALDAADADSLRKPWAVFEGTAREAAIKFPKNANVTATIAIAGIGFDRTRVTLLADPSVRSNVHVIEAEGDFGRLYTEIAARTISPATTSSKIVAGSVTHSIVSRVERITV